MAGLDSQITEYNIAVEVLARQSDFDPVVDSIARVEIHRLRKKLVEYYRTEGAQHNVRIQIPPGSYVPEFVGSEDPACGERFITVRSSSNRPAPPPTIKQTDAAQASLKRFTKRRWALVLAGAVLLGGVAAWLIDRSESRRTSTVASAEAGSATTAAPSLPASTPPAAFDSPGIRILCGQRQPRVDRWGRAWSADRYFEGGETALMPPGYLERTFDPSLFQGARVGDFSYAIPVGPGVYELHLYFVETVFGAPHNGGENSRMFHVALNRLGRILSEFDVIADAGGPGIVDERVFKDVSPGPDGLVRIRFITSNYKAMVNAIRLEPAQRHRLNPVRMITQDRVYQDRRQLIWTPEDYWLGGQMSPRTSRMEHAGDLNLYASERFGNFSYTIPVDEGEYRLTLHFAETFWGRENPGSGGTGSRVFDVFCNGACLLRHFDIYKDSGADREVVKTFHHLKANGQGKLFLSFVPVRNFASVHAIEVEDESPR